MAFHKLWHTSLTSETKEVVMKMKIWGLASAVTACATVALLAACGGSSDKGSSTTTTAGGTTTTTVPSGGFNTSQATITAASVKETLAGLSDMASCTTTGITGKLMPSQANGELILKTLKIVMATPTAKSPKKSVALVSTTKPADSTGTCGGTISYPTYSHSNGTTTLTASFANFCSQDSTTGNKTYINGTVNAVDTGTPTASGPVTTKLTANIPSLTIIEKTSAGTTVSSSSLKLSNFVYTPATGASADISNLPGSFTVGSFEASSTEGTTTKSYKVENVSISTTKSGENTSMTMSMRVYRGTSGYSDVATTSPLIIDPDQNLQSGAIKFTGANGTSATITAIPGTGQNFSISVPGDTSLANARLSCDGL